MYNHYGCCYLVNTIYTILSENAKVKLRRVCHTQAGARAAPQRENPINLYTKRGLLAL